MPIQGYGPVAGPRKPRARIRTERAAIEPERQEIAAYQQTFDWTVPVSRARQASQEAVRYCDAPVATPMHRAAAAVLDYSLVLIAVGVLMMLLHAVAGGELINLRTLPYFGLLAGAFALGYKLLWAAVGTDSPGLRWTQLRTLNFDGRVPTDGQRFARVFAACISVLGGGLGLLWSAADEETLSWHDHMSKTFLTLNPRQQPED
jgi:uncharacterized RDD family membrane protein YckC